MNATSVADFLLSLNKDRMGRFGETVCENVLRASGVTYIPLCKIEMGGAPLAVSDRKKIVVPDYDIAADGISAYVDAKVKTKCVRYRNTGQVRHGIDATKYEQYVAMGVLQRKECGLFLIELLDDSGNWSGTLMSESFIGLGRPTRGFSNQHHMVYWPRNRFAIIGSFSAEDLLAIAKGQMQVEMSAILTTAFSAPPRTCASHNDPSLWYEDPTPDSRGLLRTTCRICHKFIGYRPYK